MIRNLAEQTSADDEQAVNFAGTVSAAVVVLRCAAGEVEVRYARNSRLPVIVVAAFAGT